MCTYAAQGLPLLWITKPPLKKVRDGEDIVSIYKQKNCEVKMFKTEIKWSPVSHWCVLASFLSSCRMNHGSHISISPRDFPHTNSPYKVTINYVWHNWAILRCFIFSRELSLCDILGCTYFFQVCFQTEYKFLVISSVNFPFQSLSQYLSQSESSINSFWFKWTISVT